MIKVYEAIIENKRKHFNRDFMEGLDLSVGA